MNRPRVSIIIPVYNGKDLIEECLDSILALKYSDWECIIVDDGSTDGSDKILEEFVEKVHIANKFHIKHQNNYGVSTARNAGLDLACGEWVCFVDIDDSLSDNFLNINDFKRNAELIVKNFQYKNRKDKYHQLIEGIYTGENLNTLLSKSLFLSHFLCPWTKLFRREIIERQHIRFNPKYKFGEDTLFVESYLKHVKTLYVSPEGHYLYMVSPYNKYIFPISKAIEYMQDFADVFFSLRIRCPEMARCVLIWHSGFSTDFHGLNKLRWYCDPAVNKLYRHAYRLFPASMRAKIWVFTLLSFFRIKHIMKNLNYRPYLV